MGHRFSDLRINIPEEKTSADQPNSARRAGLRFSGKTIPQEYKDRQKDGEPSSQPALTLTEADSGKTFSVLLGSEIAIELRDNPTTGFSWSCEMPDQTGLYRVSSDYTQDPAPPGMYGVGGTRKLLFRAAQNPGTFHLRLKHRQPWEGGMIGSQLDITINVETAPSSKLEESKHPGKNSSSEIVGSDDSSCASLGFTPKDRE
jgi:inhibitor of cysteine peptidase